MSETPSQSYAGNDYTSGTATELYTRLQNDPFIAKTLDEKLKALYVYELENDITWKTRWKKIGNICIATSKLIVSFAIVFDFMSGVYDRYELTIAAGCINTVALSMLAYSSFAFSRAKSRSSALLTLSHVPEIPQEPTLTRFPAGYTLTRTALRNDSTNEPYSSPKPIYTTLQNRPSFTPIGASLSSPSPSPSSTFVPSAYRSRTRDSPVSTQSEHVVDARSVENLEVPDDIPNRTYHSPDVDLENPSPTLVSRPLPSVCRRNPSVSRLLPPNPTHIQPSDDLV